MIQSRRGFLRAGLGGYRFLSGDRRGSAHPGAGSMRAWRRSRWPMEAVAKLDRPASGNWLRPEMR